VSWPQAWSLVCGWGGDDAAEVFWLIGNSGLSISMSLIDGSIREVESGLSWHLADAPKWGEDSWEIRP